MIPYSSPLPKHERAFRYRREDPSARIASLQKEQRGGEIISSTAVFRHSQVPTEQHNKNSNSNNYNNNTNINNNNKSNNFASSSARIARPVYLQPTPYKGGGDNQQLVGSPFVPFAHGPGFTDGAGESPRSARTSISRSNSPRTPGPRSGSPRSRGFSSPNGRLTSDGGTPFHGNLFVDTDFGEEKKDSVESSVVEGQNTSFSSRYTDSPTKQQVGAQTGTKKQQHQIQPALSDHQFQQRITHIVMQKPSDKKDYHIWDVNPTSEPLNDVAEIKKVIDNPEYLNNPKNRIHSNDHARMYCPLNTSLYVEFNALPVYKEPPAFLTADKYLATSPVRQTMKPETDFA